jgi:hypothetical protein
MGGIIFKKVSSRMPHQGCLLTFHQAMVLANERDIYKGILSSVSGVIFFGTPHQGSDIANFADVLLTISSKFGGSHHLVKALKRNSDKLFDNSKQFVDRGHALKIRTFYETEPYGGVIVCFRRAG